MTLSVDIRNFIKSTIKSKFKDITFPKKDLFTIVNSIFESAKKQFENIIFDDVSDYLNRYISFVNDELIMLSTKRNQINKQLKTKEDIEAEIDEKINKKLQENKYVIDETNNEKDKFIMNETNKVEIDDELNEIEKKREQIVEKLKNIKYNDQRSQEWFKQRDKMITASDAGCIVNINEHEPQYNFIIKKTERTPFATNEFCYHGKKFEKIALLIYEHQNNVHVADFGLVEHEKYPFIGASPDGIIDFKADGKSKTKLVGRMIEIKCPLIRRIKKNGEDNIPKYYWAQVQLQLETCDLDECDFWQCDISEYMCRKDFIEDTDASGLKSKETECEKGVMIELVPEKKDFKIYDDTIFVHPTRIDMTIEECDQWILETIDLIKTKHNGYLLSKVVYWRLNEFSKVLIPRDIEWFKNSLSEMEKIWDCVLFMRANNDKYKIFYNYIQSLKIKSNKKIMDVLYKICNTSNKDYMDNIGNIINETNKNTKKKKIIEKKIETSDIFTQEGFIIY
jgi:putative phage-type endonuclease